MNRKRHAITMSDPLPKPETPPAAETNIQPALPTAPVPDAPPPVREEIAYQPMSGFAVAGFGASALFALLVVISTIVALSQGAPFFLHPAIIFIAIAGVVLSLLGQWHVQKSEGTRAGEKLARIGMWLAIVSGLCYLSYYYVTGLALESQANNFLMTKADDDSGFFPRLREGATEPVQLNAAFLLTRPNRAVRPDNELDMIRDFDQPTKDGMPGDLSAFKYGLSPGSNGIFSRIFFGQSAKDAEVTPLAVQEWKYEQKSYQVRRNYRIKTKEINWEFTILVMSKEAESAGQGRKWFINMNQSGPVVKDLTDFGKGLPILRFGAKKDLEERIGKLNAGNPLTNARHLDKTEWGKHLGDDFRQKQELLYKVLEDKTPNRIHHTSVLSNGSEIGRWEEVGDKVRIHTAFRIGLPKTPDGPPVYWIDAYAVHQPVKGGIDPANLDPFAPPPDMELINFSVHGIMPFVLSKGGPP